MSHSQNLALVISVEIEREGFNILHSFNKWNHQTAENYSNDPFPKFKSRSELKNPNQ